MIEILDKETEFTDARNYELLTGRSSPVFGFSDTRLQQLTDAINTMLSAMQDMDTDQKLKIVGVITGMISPKEGHPT